MAFLQSDLPPSTAPISVAPAVRLRTAAAPARRDHPHRFGRLLFGLLATALLIVLGSGAARATESLAIGIMAADLVFLLAVAGWSSVAGSARR
jgi:hypothetical protein